MATNEEVGVRYTNAVNSFVNKVKEDINVLAVILCGSLAYDTVWEKSDVDMMVVIRDQKIETHSYCIDEDDIYINVEIVERSKFKRSYEKQIGGSFFHSFLAKGKVLYSTDESFTEFFEEMKFFGRSDAELAMLRDCGWLAGCMDKAEKWIKVKNDVMYSRFYLLKAAEAIAHMEICKQMNGEAPTREAVLRATQLNPELMNKFYHIPMTKELNEKEILQLIKEMDKYMESCLPFISAPVIEYMEDGEIKSVTMICRHFNIDPHEASHVFEYLAEKRVVEKVSQTIRITPKGKRIAEEVAFLYVN